MNTRAFFVMVASFAIGTTSLAHAEESAQKLFDEAIKAAKEGKTDIACSLFRASHAKEPTSGTFLNVAICAETEGDHVSAYNAFRESSERARAEGKSERVELSSKKADALTTKVARMVLRGAQLGSRTVFVDGSAVSMLAQGPVALRAGSRIVELRAGDQVLSRSSITAVVGQTVTLDIPEETRNPAPVPSAGPKAPVEPPEAPQSDSKPRSDSKPPPVDGSGQRTLALVVGGVGVLAAGAGAVTGMLAFSKKSDADDARAAGNRTAFDDATKQGGTFADVSTVSFIVGGAAMLGGAVLFFTAPKESRATVGAVMTPSGGALHARF